MVDSPDRNRRLPYGLLGGAALGLALSVAGCEALRGVKIDNPVMGPAPPRLESVSSTDPLMTASTSAETPQAIGDYLQVGFSQEMEIPNTAVVATVNGEPILAGEILAGYRPYLEAARGKGASTGQINAMRRQAIKKSLDATIDQVLLAQQVRLMLTKDQSEQLEKKLTEAYDKMIRKLMKKKGIPSEVELERALAARGESLAAYEQHFRTSQLAQLYLQRQRGSQTKVFGRPEILEYYQEHQQKFSHEERARFQLLEILYQEHGGKKAARKRLQAALAALESDTPFPTVVEQFSDGPRADRGGQWDWITPGEFANEQIDEAIFACAVGQVSKVIETDSSFLLVRVTDREEAGVASLTEVQQEIRAFLEKRYRKQQREKLFDRLRGEAVIIRHLETDSPVSPESKVVPASGQSAGHAVIGRGGG